MQLHGRSCAAHITLVLIYSCAPLIAEIEGSCDLNTCPAACMGRLHTSPCWPPLKDCC
jgi:hypothetical protein